MKSSLGEQTIRMSEGDATDDALGLIDAMRFLGTGAPKHMQAYIGPCVYFVGEAYRRPDAIKIGRATNVLKRLKTLQIGCPFEMRLLAVAPGADELEYHRRFYRHRIHGEWFRPVSDIVKEIKRINESAHRR